MTHNLIPSFNLDTLRLPLPGSTLPQHSRGALIHSSLSLSTDCMCMCDGHAYIAMCLQNITLLYLCNSWLFYLSCFVYSPRCPSVLVLAGHTFVMTDFWIPDNSRPDFGLGLQFWSLSRETDCWVKWPNVGPLFLSLSISLSVSPVFLSGFLVFSLWSWLCVNVMMTFRFFSYSH